MTEPRSVLAAWLWQFNDEPGDGEPTSQNFRQADDLLDHLRACRLQVTVTEPLTPHQHEWQAHGLVSEDEVSYSPVSTLDHTVRTNQYAVQSCACGEVRRTLVARGEWRWRNRRNAS